MQEVAKPQTNLAKLMGMLSPKNFGGAKQSGGGKKTAFPMFGGFLGTKKTGASKDIQLVETSQGRERALSDSKTVPVDSKHSAIEKQ